MAKIRIKYWSENCEKCTATEEECFTKRRCQYETLSEDFEVQEIHFTVAKETSEILRIEILTDENKKHDFGINTLYSIENMDTKKRILKRKNRRAAKAFAEDIKADESICTLEWE